MRGSTRLWGRTEGTTRRGGVVVRFVRGIVMTWSKARTQRRTPFALERQLKEALAPFASDTRNLPDGPSCWVATRNREANPTISRRPRRRPGFSHIKIHLFLPLLVPSLVAPFEKSSARRGWNLDKVTSWQSLLEFSRALGKKGTGYQLEIPKIEWDRRLRIANMYSSLCCLSCEPGNGTIITFYALWPFT